jgi:hypothetical protein
MPKIPFSLEAEQEIDVVVFPVPPFCVATAMTMSSFRKQKPG